MKKIMSLILATTFILTGCSTTSNVSNTPTLGPAIESPVVDTSTIDKKPVEKLEVSNYKNMVVEYSSDDIISEMLIDKGHFDVRDVGYALYPNSDYLYPEYLIVDGVLQVVYLKSSLSSLYNASSKSILII